jgi:hypothetical protein
MSDLQPENPPILLRREKRGNWTIGYWSDGNVTHSQPTDRARTIKQTPPKTDPQNAVLADHR